MAGHDKPVAELQSWVQCDACSKWRRVPQSLADSLPDDVKWFCAANPDTAHNNCAVDQELTDAEIDRLQAENEQGGGAGGGGTGGGGGDAPQQHKRPPVWQLITSNNYTHRERKEQDEDDIMICQCKKVWATDHTSVGCGPECLNRMLNIECVEEYCPSGHRCSNRMFTKREYSNIEVKRAGAKGFGLFAAADLKAGQFIIEYLGEVLEEDEYHRRKEYFIQMGQRHFYFMNVGNGEVIDASRRGNLGRFINHSCEPNCETQKWVVHGELAIGLFTLVDIPKGTELTFDYNFERYGDKPMKCLCGSKNCRGVIGGAQDRESSAAARAALEAAAVDPTQLEEDPDYIMVTEKERDASLMAILDRVVGLGWEKGWTPKLSQRLNKLAVQHGVDLASLSDDEEEGAATAIAAASSGMNGPEEEEEEEYADPLSPAVRKAARGKAGAGKAGGRKQQQKGRKPARQRKAAAVSEDEDWQAELSEASSDEGGAEAGEGGEGSPGDSDDDMAAVAARLGRASSQGAQAAAKAAAAAAAATAVPFRKRLKRFVRAAAAAEAASTPVGSTGSRSRLGSASKPSQSVASSTPGSAGGLLIPKRAAAGPATPAGSTSFVKRRSEIDRRLDELVNASGRLRDTHPDVVIRVLRLFNLCEIGPIVSKMDSGGDQDSLGGPPRPASAGTQRSDGSGGSLPRNGSGSVTDMHALAPLPRPDSGGSLAAQAAAALAAQAAAALQAQAAALGGGGGGGGQREEGELPSPEPSPEQRGAPQHHHLQPPAASPPQGSPGKEARGERSRRAEVASRVRAAWDEAQRSGTLSARQSARIADFSLLLEVVLKTNTLSARKDFVKCGILRQLLGVVGGNTGKQYGTILKKVLRVVESLPLTADDLHHTRSAHGSFADLLREMSQSTDFEIRSTSYGLLKKFPVQDCTRPVASDPLYSAAGSSRGRQLPPTPGSAGGLPPPPGQQWRGGPPPPMALMPGMPPPGASGPFGGPPRDGPPPPPPPPPGHYGSPMQHLPPRDMPPRDGWRRDAMPPSRFGPGRLPPGAHPMGPGRPGPPPMGRPPPPGLPPPHHYQPQQHLPPPHHFPPGEEPHGVPPQQHPGMGRPPQPPPAPGATPGANGTTPGAGDSSRKRSRWDQAGPAAAAGAPGAGAPGGAPGEAPPPGSAAPRGPPGFGPAWQQEPPSKRPATGAEERPNGLHGGGSFAQALDSAHSWDVESQFALGTAGSYLGAAAAAGGDQNMSPDAAPSAAPARTYSPVASPARAASGPGPARPASAAYSYGSGGRAAAPASANGGGGVHVSPMSDEEGQAQANGGGGGGAAEEPPAAAWGVQQDAEPAAGLASAASLQLPPGGEWPEAWDEPDASFAVYVADMVRRRVGKYAQPDHPMRITQDEAGQLYTKIRREILGKEQSAYRDRQAAGAFKPIERSKLEIKIREFTRDSIRRYHERHGNFF